MRWEEPESSQQMTAVAPLFVAAKCESLPPDPLSGSAANISQALGGVPYGFVDSEAGVTDMLDALPTTHSDVPLLGIDLEGLNLGKKGGKTYLVQIYDSHSHHLYIVDIFLLGHAAFSTAASDGATTLQTVLQATDALKIFCDVRDDSYALFQEFGIRLGGIKDVQYIEIASRPKAEDRDRRNGLVKLINVYANLTNDERSRAGDNKTRGQKICSRWGLRPIQCTASPRRSCCLRGK